MKRELQIGNHRIVIRSFGIILSITAAGAFGFWIGRRHDTRAAHAAPPVAFECPGPALVVVPPPAPESALDFTPEPRNETSEFSSSDSRGEAPSSAQAIAASAEARPDPIASLASRASFLPIPRVRRGSLLELLGLRTGDQLLRVNGLDVGSPEQALRAYTRVRLADRIVLEVRRADRIVELSYRII